MKVALVMYCFERLSVLWYNTRMKKWYIVMIVMECIGCFLSFLDGGMNNLVYFTVLSNGLTLMTGIFCLLAKKDTTILQMLRYISVVCLSLTFFIVCFVFVPMSIPYGTQWKLILQGPQPFHHVLCPILAFYLFGFVEKDMRITNRQVLVAVIPTLVYGLVMMMANALYIVDGPYPFFHVHQQSILVSVLWFVGINGFAYVIAKGIAKVHNFLQKI